MRILHVNKFLYRRGGAEAYMLDVSELQSEEGHDVAFFGMQHPENTATSLAGGVRFIDFQAHGPVQQARKIGRMFWSVTAQTGMRRAITEFRPDIIHAHNIYHQLSPSLLHAASSAHIPTVLTMHDYKLVCPTYQFLDAGKPCMACVDSGLGQAVVRACSDGSRAASAVAAAEVGFHRLIGAYEHVSTFIAPSHFLADAVARAGLFEGRVEILPNFSSLHTKPRTGAGVYIAFIGRLSPEKGLQSLIQATGMLVARGLVAGNDPVHVVGEGDDGPMLRRMAAQLAPEQVIFHGRLDRSGVQKVLSQARAIAVPSVWYENMPMTVLEAFSAGVPVIATRMGGLPEMVDDSVGWTVEPHAPSELAEAMRQAIENPDISIMKGERARHLAETRYSSAYHLERLNDLYNRAISKCRR